MLRISGIALGVLMMAGSAQAATIGLVCDGVVHLVVAPTEEKAGQCAAALPGSCEEGFRIDNGYFAIAQSSDGVAQGISAGSPDAASAEQTAMSTCETQGGAGACSITSAGNDDGNTFHSCE